ncbi:MAG: SprB repeat-containing protein, partial [Bacteroidia bacterium]|nr:SprB repeat-containing protein [Bacteroidia bacterium]
MSGFFVELTKWNTATQQTDIIGEAWFISQINVSTWTSVNLPISYSSGNIPDTLYISAFSSLGNSNFPVPTIPNPVSGSEFYIDAITINLPSCAGLSVSASGTNETAPLAANGTASVTASGGATPYSYLWSNGATSASISNLSNGVYNVTVTDANGCSKVTSYNVLAGGCNGLSVVATGTNATSFTSNNGMATATATGGTPPYTYLWNNGATTASISNLDVGAYIVSVTD